MADDIDIMEDLLAGHALSIADEKANALEGFLEDQKDDPTVFDNIDEGLEDD